MSCVGNLFSVPMMWTSMLIHGDYLSFSCDAVEICFDVITQGRANVMKKLLCIFEEHDMVECEVVNRFFLRKVVIYDGSVFARVGLTKCGLGKRDVADWY